jgi:hypothetical protein
LRKLLHEKSTALWDAEVHLLLLMEKLKLKEGDLLKTGDQ